MPRRKNTTIPKFGNWDKKEDLSYSIVFDAARADKEKFMYMSHEDEHERYLFKKMSKELQVTPSQPSLEAKASGLADNNVKIPYHHTPMIGNEIPKQTDGLGLKDFVSGEPTYEIKENRIENHAQFLYESHHRKLQGKSNESRMQGNPAAKMSDKTSVPRFGNWNVSDDSSKEGFTVVFDRARNEKMSGERTALGNISPLNFPKKDFHVSSKGSKIFKKKKKLLV